MEKNKGDLLIWNSQIPVMITISHEFPPVFVLYINTSSQIILL